MLTWAALFSACLTRPRLSFDRSAFAQTRLVTAVAVEAASCSKVIERLRPHVLRLRGVQAVHQDGKRRLVLLSLPPPLPPDVEQIVASLGGVAQEHSLAIGYEQLTAAEALRELLPAGMEVPSAFEQVGHVAHVNLRDEQLPYKALIGEVLLDKNAPRVRSVVNKVAPISDEFRVFPMEVLAGDESLETEVRENGAVYRLDYRMVYWNSRLESEHRRLVSLLAAPPPGAAIATASPATAAAAASTAASTAAASTAAASAADSTAADDGDAPSPLASAAVVCDMFAGIGPFAIPAALRGCARVAATDPRDLRSPPYAPSLRTVCWDRCAVYANDLNPESARYLRLNAAANGVAGRVAVTQMDARAFVRSLLAAADPADSAAAPTADARGDSAIGVAVATEAAAADEAAAAAAAAAPLRYGPFGHVVMNLPATALDFLDVFVGAFDRARWAAPLPHCHCYCFSAADDPAADAVARAEAALGCALPGARAVLVRDVAPRKMMVCVSFQLPEVAWAET